MNKAVLYILIIIVIVGGAVLFLNNRQSKTSPNTQKEVSASPTTTGVSPTETTTTGAMSQNAIEIKDFAFSPATLTVKVGDTVTWTNQDSAPHSATADDSSFDTGVLSKGISGT